MSDERFEQIICLIAFEAFVLTVFPGTQELVPALIGTLVVAPIGAWLAPKIFRLFGGLMG